MDARGAVPAVGAGSHRTGRGSSGRVLGAGVWGSSAAPEVRLPPLCGRGGARRSVSAPARGSPVGPGGGHGNVPEIGTSGDTAVNPPSPSPSRWRCVCSGTVRDAERGKRKEALGPAAGRGCQGRAQSCGRRRAGKPPEVQGLHAPQSGFCRPRLLPPPLPSRSEEGRRCDFPVPRILPPPLTAFPSPGAAVRPAGLCLRLTPRGTPPSPPVLRTPDPVPGERHLPTPPPNRCGAPRPAAPRERAARPAVPP